MLPIYLGALKCGNENKLAMNQVPIITQIVLIDH